eukprot:CAMPEP_0180810598 /NCGR_PEP_ID=MMETSP1038_2-20121128/64971_1 /TAXON_ID=632150 /ORGANISM="Azadinium spinosum, Strain 3D9" /LENGTH=411 /DNA_ID=CAMNT_0022851901 /DNA_START=20 /DNA_END=1255 /DNA_ORIENTATION=+
MAVWATTLCQVSALEGPKGILIGVEAELTLADVPQCTRFKVLVHVSLVPFPEGIAVTRGIGVTYLRGVPWPQAVEASMTTLLDGLGESIPSFLRKRAKDYPGAIGVSQLEDLCEIWELQRRPTVFHSSWSAPFLPHDGGYRRRWVSKDYGQHPWLKESLEFCAQQDVPPVKGRRHRASSWRVVQPPGPCDAEGWQYAVEFVQDPSWWSDSSSYYHCRRRLWRRDRDPKLGQDLEDEEDGEHADCQAGEASSSSFDVFGAWLGLDFGTPSREEERRKPARKLQRTTSSRTFDEQVSAEQLRQLKASLEATPLGRHGSRSSKDHRRLVDHYRKLRRLAEEHIGEVGEAEPLTGPSSRRALRQERHTQVFPASPLLTGLSSRSSTRQERSPRKSSKHSAETGRKQKSDSQVFRV